MTADSIRCFARGISKLHVNRNKFEPDQDTILHFCKFAVKFFENVEDPKPRS